MFKILMFALLVFLNCGSDKTQPGGVESDPTGQLWGYWFANFEVDTIPYEALFVFQQNGTLLYRSNEKKGLGGLPSKWKHGSYTYDRITKIIIYSPIDFPDIKWIILYDGGGSFAFNDIVYTKQDTLPDWAE